LHGTISQQRARRRVSRRSVSQCEWTVTGRWGARRTISIEKGRPSWPPFLPE
jgi:hypothetical protein